MSSNRPLVLVVDDDPFIAQSTALVLEVEGFDVVTAKDGEEGIEVAKGRRPAVILLDIMMPGINGWETLECLKTDQVTGSIPVIIFSARDLQRGRSVAKGNGADSYLAKPFDPIELVRLIRKQLDGVPAQKSA